MTLGEIIDITKITKTIFLKDVEVNLFSNNGNKGWWFRYKDNYYGNYIPSDNNVEEMLIQNAKDTLNKL